MASEEIDCNESYLVLVHACSSDPPRVLAYICNHCCSVAEPAGAAKTKALASHCALGFVRIAWVGEGPGWGVWDARTSNWTQIFHSFSGNKPWRLCEQDCSHHETATKSHNALHTGWRRAQASLAEGRGPWLLASGIQCGQPSLTLFFDEIWSHQVLHVELGVTALFFRFISPELPFNCHISMLDLKFALGRSWGEPLVMESLKLSGPTSNLSANGRFPRCCPPLTRPLLPVGLSLVTCWVVAW